MNCNDLFDVDGVGYLGLGCAWFLGVVTVSVYGCVSSMDGCL